MVRVRAGISYALTEAMAGAGLCRDHPQKSGLGISCRSHPGHDAALRHAATEPSLYWRYTRQAAGRAGWAEEGRSHCGAQRLGPAALVKTKRMASSALDNDARREPRGQGVAPCKHNMARIYNAVRAVGSSEVGLSHRFVFREIRSPGGPNATSSSPSLIGPSKGSKGRS
jgi:hypothetical protein